MCVLSEIASVIRGLKWKFSGLSSEPSQMVCFYIWPLPLPSFVSLHLWKSFPLTVARSHVRMLSPSVRWASAQLLGSQYWTTLHGTPPSSPESSVNCCGLSRGTSGACGRYAKTQTPTQNQHLWRDNTFQVFHAIAWIFKIEILWASVHIQKLSSFRIWCIFWFVNATVDLLWLTRASVHN